MFVYFGYPGCADFFCLVLARRPLSPKQIPGDGYLFISMTDSLPQKRITNVLSALYGVFPCLFHVFAVAGFLFCLAKIGAP